MQRPDERRPHSGHKLSEKPGRDAGSDDRHIAPANQNPPVSGGGQPPSYPFSARLKLIHNEQSKLSATAVNNVAVAFIVIGIVTPLVGIGHAQAVSTDVAAYVISLGWLLTGIILHLFGRLILVRLEP